jgi:hypothetical protein
VLDLWPTALSTRSRRRRPSLRVGLPWGASLVGWLLAARLSVDGRAFDGGWLRWLAVGGLLVPGVVSLVSLPLGVRPRLRAVLACAAASLAGTALSVALLRASGGATAFTFLGGLLVSALAAGAFALATADGNGARRDAVDP